VKGVEGGARGEDFVSRYAGWLVVSGHCCCCGGGGGIRFAFRDVRRGEGVRGVKWWWWGCLGVNGAVIAGGAKVYIIMMFSAPKFL
jgi:hypothetical protein